jgi:hypothetical protein
MLTNASAKRSSSRANGLSWSCSPLDAVYMPAGYERKSAARVDTLTINDYIDWNRHLVVLKLPRAEVRLE